MEKNSISIKMKEQQSNDFYPHFFFVVGDIQKNLNGVFLSPCSPREDESRNVCCVVMCNILDAHWLKPLGVSQPYC